MARKVVLTGMRTTGQLHLGHKVGALDQWLSVQKSGEYECYFLLADIQALTTHADRPVLLRQSVRDVVLDWLSVGLDPSLPHVHFVLQSQVLERHELSILFGMVAKYGEVMRDPTLKNELEQQQDASLGFLYYPVDQIADIQMVDPMERGGELLVPVGEDQLPHLELAREVVRRFNNKYGTVFTECQGLVGKVGRLVGTDGNAKMSKSMGNTINLNDPFEVINRAIDRMPIDPARTVRAGHLVPGDPEKAAAIIYHRALNPDYDEVQQVEVLYRQASIGDGDIKERLKEVVREVLTPIKAQREHFEHDADITEIVANGTEAARQACVPVAKAMREHMYLTFPD
ncbi:tryptophan--tRNA ligase [Candidatus Microgenomates bacterium]|nr:MAG: tryptophan--tRNA ligase [Candidatus Microgenomates bacterium]